MDASSFARTHLVVGESNRIERQAIRTALIQQGMAKVIDCADSDLLATALNEHLFDVLIYDYGLPGSDFAETMQRIRRKEFGKNPCVSVIATVPDGSLETIKGAIDAGADDVIRKPISVTQLFRRMSLLIEKRKPFVVAHDYVGPNRKLERGPDEKPDALIDVPNTLRGRVIDKLSEGDLAMLVDKNCGPLNEKQLDASGVEVIRLAHRIVGSYDGDGDPGEWRGWLNRLVVVGQTMRKVHEGTPTQALADLAVMVGILSKRLLATTPFERVIEVDLLYHLGQAIHRALTVERDAVQIMIQISGVISRFTGESAH